jgi:hypothetical protein
MWGFVVTRNTAAGAILLCFNSFIHTLMYTYFTYTAFGYSSPFKNLLTIAQMVQFVVGIIIVTPAYQCYNEAQAINTALLQVYAIYLFWLFFCFYKESYSTKSSSSKKGK